MRLLPTALLLFSLIASPTVGFAQSSRAGVWDIRQSQPAAAPTAGTSRYPAARAATSTGARSKNNNTFVETISVDGLTRNFTVHLPPTFDSRRQPALVLALHGAGMNMESMRGLTLFDSVADRNGFIVVYPEGYGHRWNAGGPKQMSGANDVRYISGLIQHMRTRYNINPRAVYACGISNGGQMVQRLACELSDQIAAIGVVAITGFDSVCRSCGSRRAIPVMFFIGTDDALCPRENGESKTLGKLGTALGLGDLPINSTIAKYADIMTAEGVVEFWASRNGSPGSPRVERIPDRDTRDGCKVTKETYGGGSREVTVYTIEGGGHSWPGGMGFVIEDKLGRTTSDIDASQLLWDFFRSHSL